MFFVGAHLPISKGYFNAGEIAEKIGANTFQFFTRNPRGAGVKALDPKDLAIAKSFREEKGFGPLVAHAPYIINLAAPRDDIWELAVRIMKEDLARQEEAGVAYLAVHPGSHVGSGVKVGIEKIQRALNQIFKESGNTMVLLETMSGSGSEVGGNFEEIAEIISGVEAEHRLGVCLDTCHLFGAGYDISKDLTGVLEEFDKEIGVEKIKAIHLNDSKMPLGSKKDRHASLGEGLIGLDSIEKIINEPLLRDKVFILETPGDLEGFEKEIALLRSMR